MSDELVLVTGGPGYIGSRIVVNALKAGSRVRTTVRSLEKEVTLRAMALESEAGADDKLSVVVADLQNDEGCRKLWTAVTVCCTWHHQHFKPFQRRRTK